MKTRAFRMTLFTVAGLWLARRSWARGVLKFVVRLTEPGRRRSVEKRTQRAKLARLNPGKAVAELFAAGLTSVIFLVWGMGCMIAAIASDGGDRAFFAASAMAGFALFALSLARIADHEMTIVDANRIDSLEFALRRGHIPAND